ncbi:hypothetical protein B0T17DRAFT_614761 [Bombardia bombarda]|uniref:Uncharacterized protein n=1 Tax=Bombardia bombarda TaxID=252184 RepID=A0AA40C8W4_9PEZI|nr:hypothetical protein B0T17DRAFT_614761 [Bombardia bombarda]
MESSTLFALEDGHEAEGAGEEVGFLLDARSYQPEEEEEEVVVERVVKDVSEPEAELPEVRGVSAKMWQPLALEKGSSSKDGMFVCDPSRADYRTTSQEPAAKEMGRKQRIATLKPLDRLASANVWRAENIARQIQQQQHWLKFPKVVSAGLWQPTLRSDGSLERGLFKLDANRTEYRTTALEPAAKEMDRKLRPAVLEPLGKLTSTSLWSVESASKKMERNWLKLDSEKKVSVGMWQMPQLADTSSDRQLFTFNSNRTVFRTTTQEPAAKDMARKPRPAVLQPLEQLSSTSLWTVENSAKQATKHWTGQQPPHKTGLPPYGRPSRPATRSDGLPPARGLGRRSPRGNPSFHPRPTFDSATRHPVFAASSLATRSEWFHPAAKGYTYDIAIVHPAFFGSLAITCPLESVHPAMAAYAAKKLRRQRSKRDVSSGSSRERSRSRGHGSSSSSSSSYTHSHSLSRSDSSRSLRKDEIRAQIRALEQEEVVPVPPVPAFSADPMFQAQMEAMEQERLYIQKAAREDYNRRATMRATYYAQEEQMPSTPLEELQRQMASQVRQSLVWMKSEPALSVAEAAGVGANVAASEGVEAKRAARPYRAQMPEPERWVVGEKEMWSAPVVRREEEMVVGGGMWPSVGTTAAAQTTSGEEDSEAWARRARGRKMMQKKARRAEILAQIAAIEAGVDLTAVMEFRGKRLWRVGGGKERKMRREARGGGRDWLRFYESRDRHASRVMLRY